VPWQLVIAIEDEGDGLALLCLTIIRLWLHPLLCYLKIVVVEVSLQFYQHLFKQELPLSGRH
jgi:hypothetical protein